MSPYTTSIYALCLAYVEGFSTWLHSTEVASTTVDTDGVLCVEFVWGDYVLYTLDGITINECEYVGGHVAYSDSYSLPTL